MMSLGDEMNPSSSDNSDQHDDDEIPSGNTTTSTRRNDDDDDDDDDTSIRSSTSRCCVLLLLKEEDGMCAHQYSNDPNLVYRTHSSEYTPSAASSTLTGMMKDDDEVGDTPASTLSIPIPPPPNTVGKSYNNNNNTNDGKIDTTSMTTTTNRTPVDQVLMTMKDQSPSNFSRTPLSPVRLNFTYTNTSDEEGVDVTSTRVVQDMKNMTMTMQNHSSTSPTVSSVPAQDDNDDDDDDDCTGSDDGNYANNVNMVTPARNDGRRTIMASTTSSLSSTEGDDIIKKGDDGECGRHTVVVVIDNDSDEENIPNRRCQRTCLGSTTFLDDIVVSDDQGKNGKKPSMVLPTNDNDLSTQVETTTCGPDNEDPSSPMVEEKGMVLIECDDVAGRDNCIDNFDDDESKWEPITPSDKTISVTNPTTHQSDDVESSSIRLFHRSPVDIRVSNRFSITGMHTIWKHLNRGLTNNSGEPSVPAETTMDVDEKNHINERISETPLSEGPIDFTAMTRPVDFVPVDKTDGAFSVQKVADNNETPPSEGPIDVTTMTRMVDHVTVDKTDGASAQQVADDDVTPRSEEPIEVPSVTQTMDHVAVDKTDGTSVQQVAENNETPPSEGPIEVTTMTQMVDHVTIDKTDGAPVQQVTNDEPPNNENDHDHEEEEEEEDDDDVGDSERSFLPSGILQSITPGQGIVTKATSSSQRVVENSPPDRTTSPGSPVGAGFSNDIVSEDAAFAPPFVRVVNNPINEQDFDSKTMIEGRSYHPSSPLISEGPSLPSSDVDSIDQTPVASNINPTTGQDENVAPPQLLSTTTCSKLGGESNLAQESSPVPSEGSQRSRSDQNPPSNPSESDEGAGNHNAAIQSNTPRTRRVLEWSGSDSIDLVTWPVPSMGTNLISINTPERQLPTPLHDEVADTVNDVSKSPSFHITPHHLRPSPQSGLPQQTVQLPQQEIPDWWVPRVRSPPLDPTGGGGSNSSPLSLPSMLGSSSGGNEVSDLESPMLNVLYPFTYTFSEEESDIESQGNDNQPSSNSRVGTDQASDINSSTENGTTASSMQNTTDEAGAATDKVLQSTTNTDDRSPSLYYSQQPLRIIDSTGMVCSGSVCSSTTNPSNHTANEANRTMVISNVTALIESGIIKTKNTTDPVGTAPTHPSILSKDEVIDSDHHDAVLVGTATYDTTSPSNSSSVSGLIDQVMRMDRTRPWYKRRPMILCIVFALILTVCICSALAVFMTSRPNETTPENEENQSSDHDNQSPGLDDIDQHTYIPTWTPLTLTAPTSSPTTSGITVLSPTDTPSMNDMGGTTWNRLEEGEEIWREYDDEGGTTEQTPGGHPKWSFGSGTSLSPGVDITNTWGINLQVVFAAEERYLTHVMTAIDDYSSSRAVSALTLLTVPYEELCNPELGTIKVCNGDYGNTDWTASTVLFMNDEWIVGASIRISSNRTTSATGSSWLQSESSTALQYTLCHQMGHALGLPHRPSSSSTTTNGSITTSSSCMQDFGGTTTAFVDETVISEQFQHPNSDDLDYLVTLYGTPPTRRRTLEKSLRRRVS